MTIEELGAAIKCGKHPSQAVEFREKYGRPYYETLDVAAKILLADMKQKGIT